MSRIHLIDTNIFTAWVNERDPKHSGIIDRIERMGDTFIYLSSITVGEVEFGLARPHRLSDEVAARIRSALNHFSVLNIDRHAGVPYGALRAWLLDHYGPRTRRGSVRSLAQLSDRATDLELGIQENDLWLVSQAITSDSVLVTRDRMSTLVEAAEATGYGLHVDADW